MTLDEFKAIALSKLVKKVRQEIEWVDVATVVGGASTAFKLKLVEAIKTGNVSAIGGLITGLVDSKVVERATAELDGIVVNGSLSLEEYSRIFGDA